MAERPLSCYKSYEMGVVKQALLKEMRVLRLLLGRYNANNGMLLHCMHVRCMHAHHVHTHPLLREMTHMTHQIMEHSRKHKNIETYDI